MEYGKAHYEYQDIYCQADLEPVLVADGVPGGNQKKGEKPGKAWAGLTVGRARLLQEIPGPRPEGTEAMVLPVLLSPWDQVKVVRQVPDYLTAPVEAGKKVGEIVYFINGNPAAAAPVYTAEDVEAFTFGWCMGKAAEAFFGKLRKGGLFIILRIKQSERTKYPNYIEIKNNFCAKFPLLEEFVFEMT